MSLRAKVWQSHTIQIKSPEMLLYAQGLFPAKQPEPQAAKPYLYFVRSIPYASARFANALAATQANIFWLLSSEAVLLTKKNKKYVIARYEDNRPAGAH